MESFSILHLHSHDMTYMSTPLACMGGHWGHLGVDETARLEDRDSRIDVRGRADGGLAPGYVARM